MQSINNQDSLPLIPNANGAAQSRIFEGSGSD